MILLLFLGLFVTGPVLDAGDGPNQCYLPDPKWHGFIGPCKPEESRGAR